MWSIRVPERGRRVVRVPWPPALRDHLLGSGSIALRDRDDGALLAEGRFALPLDPEGLGIADLAVAGQIIDKWGKLTDAPSAELHSRLIQAVQVVLVDLVDLGYTAAITGGTLLGAIRDGAILQHDDDIDLLIYLGEADASDVSIASYALERQMSARGHQIIRHSNAHLQLVFTESGGPTSFDLEVHVDLFLGFFDHGLYNQPIAVRGEFDAAQILPLHPVMLNAVEVPSVADPEGWLALCYGPNWRTPDPSFRFETPMSTRRRFENWFGVYDLNRDFWERHLRFGRSFPWHADAERLLAATGTGERVLDLGCGGGELAAVLAAGGRRVVGFDFARSAVERASTHEGVEAHRLNLADRRAVLDVIADELAIGGTRHFLISNVLHMLTRETRANLFLLLRALLDADSQALASIAVDESAVYEHQRPDTWHLPLEWLSSELDEVGLGFQVVDRQQRRTSAGPRSIVTVEFQRIETAA